MTIDTTPNKARSGTRGTPPDAAAHAVEQVRQMIMSRRLAPGHQLRQETLAEELGVSRSPLREALRALEAEGLLRHLPNQGYFVTRLRSGELNQVYLMRRVLERELLIRLQPPGAAVLRSLSETNARMARARAAGRAAEMLSLNRAFHFEFFNLSPLVLVTRQVERLWHMSEAYRSVYLWFPATQDRILAEHEAMIDALAAGDSDLLVEIADRHRSAAETAVTEYLRGEEAAAV